MPKVIKVRADWPRNVEDCKIALVGEAPGETEVSKGHPFVGRAGWLLNNMLETTGIRRADCLVTNVFTERPSQNEIKLNFAKKREAKKLEIKSPYLANGKLGLLRPEFEPELVRLHRELTRANPNIVIALGATALWALTENYKIGDMRGVTMQSTLAPPGTAEAKFKVLATYHPAAVLRQWHFRPVVMADLHKALEESHAPDIHHTTREIWIRPTLEDVKLYDRRIHERITSEDRVILSYDIETASDEITCIGFALDRDISICIPFTDIRATGKSYWSTAAEEAAVWEYVRKWLGDPRTAKLAQNGTYDISWLARIGIKVRGIVEDTMILHHALQPELPKGLGFLGSLYTKEQAWKQLGKRKSKTQKQDD